VNHHIIRGTDQTLVDTSIKESAPRVAHLILAHAHPAQLDRLIKRLNHVNGYVFIHLDAKIDIDPFLFLEKKHTNCVLLKDRYSINWGGYSMIHATLRSMEAILKSHSFDFIQLMSGSDYPTKPIADYHEMLYRHKGKSFMEVVDDHSDWSKDSKDKITYYHLVDKRFPGRYWVQWSINGIAPRRRFPSELVFKGRSQWMTLDHAHVQYVLDFEKNNPKIIRYFKYTWGADEYFFQSILYASPFRKDLINNNWNYILWTKGKASPEILTISDLPQLLEHPSFFGRKFDPNKSKELMDELDQLHVKTE
jgi:hypothetical protein